MRGLSPPGPEPFPKRTQSTLGTVQCTVSIGGVWALISVLASRKTSCAPSACTTWRHEQVMISHFFQSASSGAGITEHCNLCLPALQEPSQSRLSLLWDKGRHLPWTPLSSWRTCRYHPLKTSMTHHSGGLTSFPR